MRTDDQRIARYRVPSATLPWLVCILNLPMLTCWYLSVALPTSQVVIAVALTIEMFGYGFGFVGIILLMMQEIAPGKYQTAHYAFANSLMNLGLILPGAVSGWIQSQLGYPPSSSGSSSRRSLR